MTTHDDLTARARQLAPALAERARAAEEMRRLPAETLEELVAAGFHKILLPRAVGGHELGLDTAFGVSRELAKGCTSTSWVATIYILHNWMIGMLPEKAQREVFDGPGPVLPAGTLAPTGTAERVDDGYRVSGRWRWGSGIVGGSHALVCAAITGDPADHPAERRMFLIDVDQLEIDDVWFTSGMLATASNDIVVRDAYVPEMRTLPTASLLTTQTPGRELYDIPAYRWPVIPIIALSAAAPALGTAEAVLERYDDHIRQRRIAFSGIRHGDTAGAQTRLARATAEIAGARLLFDDTVGRIQRTYAAGGVLDLVDRARCRLVAAHVVHAARTAVDLLAAGSGASAQFLDSPFQRAQRDLNMIACHLVSDLDATYELYGRIKLGLDIAPGTLV